MSIRRVIVLLLLLHGTMCCEVDWGCNTCIQHDCQFVLTTTGKSAFVEDGWLYPDAEHVVKYQLLCEEFQHQIVYKEKPVSHTRVFYNDRYQDLALAALSFPVLAEAHKTANVDALQQRPPPTRGTRAAPRAPIDRQRYRAPLEAPPPPLSPSPPLPPAPPSPVAHKIANVDALQQRPPPTRGTTAAPRQPTQRQRYRAPLEGPLPPLPPLPPSPPPPRASQTASFEQNQPIAMRTTTAAPMPKPARPDQVTSVKAPPPRHASPLPPTLPPTPPEPIEAVIERQQQSQIRETAAAPRHMTVKLDRVAVVEAPIAKPLVPPSPPTPPTPPAPPTTVVPTAATTRPANWTALTSQPHTPPPPPPLALPRPMYTADRPQQRDMSHRIVDQRELFMTFKYSTDCGQEDRNETLLFLYVSSLCTISQLVDRIGIDSFDEISRGWFYLNPSRRYPGTCKAVRYTRKKCRVTRQRNSRPIENSLKYGPPSALFSGIDHSLECNKKDKRESAHSRLARMLCYSASLFTEVQQAIVMNNFDYGFGTSNVAFRFQYKCKALYYRKRHCFKQQQ